jgi:hypothetical protein
MSFGFLLPLQNVFGCGFVPLFERFCFVHSASVPLDASFCDHYYHLASWSVCIINISSREGVI